MNAAWAWMATLLIRARGPEPTSARDDLAHRLASVCLGVRTTVPAAELEPWRRVAAEVERLVERERSLGQVRARMVRDELRARNRAYGRASATIGQQRDRISRLLGERRFAESTVDHLRIERAGTVEQVAGLRDQVREAESVAAGWSRKLGRARALAEVDWPLTAAQHDKISGDDSAGQHADGVAAGVRACAEELLSVLDGDSVRVPAVDGSPSDLDEPLAVWEQQLLDATPDQPSTDVDENGTCRCCLGDPRTVCDACGQHSCWGGVFMCADAQGAGTRQAGTSDLDVVDATIHDADCAGGDPCSCWAADAIPADPADTAKVGDPDPTVAEAGGRFDVPWCDLSDDSYGCTRPSGHGGQHVAGDDDGSKVLHVWPQDAATAAGPPYGHGVHVGTGTASAWAADSAAHAETLRTAGFERTARQLDGDDGRERSISGATTTLRAHRAHVRGGCICGWDDDDGRTHVEHVAEQLHATGHLTHSSASDALARVAGALAARERAGDIAMAVADVRQLIDGRYRTPTWRTVYGRDADQLLVGTVLVLEGQWMPCVRTGRGWWADGEDEGSPLDPDDRFAIVYQPGNPVDLNAGRQPEETAVLDAAREFVAYLDAQGITRDVLLPQSRAIIDAVHALPVERSGR